MDNAPESNPAQPQVEPVTTQPAAPVAAAPATPPANVTVVYGGTTYINGPFPAELNGWNWGAFFSGWIWAVANNTYIGLLAFVPYVGYIMNFVLAIKGNEWAWQHRKFESVEQFRAVQKAWARWGFAIFVVTILLLAAGINALLKTGNSQAAAYDATRKSDITSIVTDIDVYALDSTNNDLLPRSLSDLGKIEPTDPETGVDYNYIPASNLLKGQICATLSDASKYCKDVTATGN